MVVNEEAPKVKILSLRATDDSLKKFCEIGASDTGRKILLALTEKEGYLNEFANKLNLTVPTLYNHLKKLEEIDVLDIVEKPISKKTKDHRYFIMKTDFFLSMTPEDEQSKLKRIFKEGVKFVSIGITSVVSFFIASDSNIKQSSSFSGLNNDGLDIENPLFPIVIFLGVLLVGLILERIYTQIKKNRV